MLSRKELAEIRRQAYMPYTPSMLSKKEISSLLDHITELEAILHDLRIDSMAYQRGVREEREACAQVAMSWLRQLGNTEAAVACRAILRDIRRGTSAMDTVPPYGT